MESKEIRLNNLLTLAGKYGRIVEFCDRINMNPSYFSQIKSGKKAIGDDIARKVEEKLGLPRGYMDSQQDEDRLQGTPPGNDALATAYSIESLPVPLREQFKRLVFQVAAYCNESSQTSGSDDIQPFEMTIGAAEANHDRSQVPKSQQK